MSATDIVERLANRLSLDHNAIDELVRVHGALWELEDQAHYPGAACQDVAALKREIDRENARRHEMIDRIDAAASLPAEAKGRQFYSQTMGELIDVLVVLQRKLDALTALVSDSRLSPAHREVYAERLHLCLAKAEHMSRFADLLTSDVLSGRATLPPRADPKLYNDGRLRALRAQQAP
jgi:hypothetical protein